MTTDQMIDGILQRELGYDEDPLDRGGFTNRGITALMLGRWRNLNRPATRAEVKNLTEAETRAIYLAVFIKPYAQIASEDLRAQVADYAVLSGSAAAIQALQRVLGVPVDGVLGPRTLAAIVTIPIRWINNSLVAERCALFSHIVDHDPPQAKFLHGWVSRAVSFRMN